MKNQKNGNFNTQIEKYFVWADGHGMSVRVVIFLAFHNPFMMLFHILMSISDHELMLDNFLITSSVFSLLNECWNKSAG